MPLLKPGHPNTRWECFIGEADEDEAKLIITPSRTSDYLVVSCATEVLKQIATATEFHGFPALYNNGIFDHSRYIPIVFHRGSATTASMFIRHERTKNRDQAERALRTLQLRTKFPPSGQASKVITADDVAQSRMKLTSVRVRNSETGEEFNITNEYARITLPTLYGQTASGLVVPIMHNPTHKYSPAGLKQFIGMTRGVAFKAMREKAGYDQLNQRQGSNSGFNRGRNSDRLANAVHTANQAYHTLPVLDDEITRWLLGKMKAWQILT